MADESVTCTTDKRPVLVQMVVTAMLCGENTKITVLVHSTAAAERLVLDVVKCMANNSDPEKKFIIIQDTCEATVQFLGKDTSPTYANTLRVDVAQPEVHQH